MIRTPRPATALGIALVVSAVALAALGTALGRAEAGPVALVVWSVAMTGPLLLLASWAVLWAWRARAREAGEAALAELEAEVGPLVGRRGRIVARAPADGLPHPTGSPRRLLLDGAPAEPTLFVLPGDPLPRSGADAVIVEVRALRPGEIPFVESGIGVRVTGADG